jgi:hypothetical protein
MCGIVGRKRKTTRMYAGNRPASSGSPGLALAIQYRFRAWQTTDVDLESAEVGAAEFVEPTV